MLDEIDPVLFKAQIHKRLREAAEDMGGGTYMKLVEQLLPAIYKLIDES